MPARPSRRTVVSAALAVPVASAAGCTLSDPPPRRASRAPRADVDPDVALLAEVSASTDAMVALYEATLDRHPGLRRDLRPLLDGHRSHAEALGDAAPPVGRDGGPGSAGRRRTRSEDDVDVPAKPRAALRRLTASERDQASDLLDATGRAASGDFARLLASMSAASTTAARLLGEAGRR